MPCLEVTLPRIDGSQRALLSKHLTEAVSSSTGLDRDILMIHFREYDAGEAAVGGELWDGRDGRPYLHLLLSCPRLRRSAKLRLVRALTDVFTRDLGKPEWLPVIHIAEHPYDNIGVEGSLLSDSYEECRKRGFYYPLPDD